MAVSEALERQVGPETAISEALGRQVGTGTAVSEALGREVGPGTAVLGTFDRGVGPGPAEAGLGRLWGIGRKGSNDEKSFSGLSTVRGSDGKLLDR